MGPLDSGSLRRRLREARDAGDLDLDEYLVELQHLRTACAFSPPPSPPSVAVAPIDSAAEAGAAEVIPANEDDDWFAGEFDDQGAIIQGDYSEVDDIFFQRPPDEDED